MARLLLFRPDARRSTLSNVLTPANDVVELGCPFQIPSSTIVVKLGGGPALFCREGRLVCPAITFGNEPYVTVTKRSDGSLSLDAQVFSSTGKILAAIEKNRFYINRKNQQFFRFTHPDAHTLIVKDDQNEVFLEARFANKTTLVITGKLYSKRGDSIRVDDKEMLYLPRGADDGLHNSGGCLGADFPIYVK